MTQFKDLLDALTYAELQQLKYDIANDATYLQKLVNTQINTIEAQNQKVCSTCGCLLEDEHPTTHTLLFGPPDLRKKASFCGIDCLELFAFKLRQYTQPSQNI